MSYRFVLVFDYDGQKIHITSNWVSYVCGARESYPAQVMISDDPEGYLVLEVENEECSCVKRYDLKKISNFFMTMERYESV